MKYVIIDNGKPRSNTIIHGFLIGGIVVKDSRGDGYRSIRSGLRQYVSACDVKQIHSLSPNIRVI